MASAAGGASVSISPSSATVAAGTSTTFTLSLSCSVTGGCAATTITFPVTTYTDLTGASVNDSAQFGNLSCASWTKTTTTSTVTYTYTGGVPAGTLATGSSQCTFVYSTTNYRTPSNQTFTLTPTINGSNFSSSSGNSATVTVTAQRKLTFAKRAVTQPVGPAVTQVGQGAQFSYVLHIDCPGDGTIPGAIGTASLSLSDQLPANFTYQSYQEIYNANNGNFFVAPPQPAFPGTVTTPNAGNNNTFTYSDPDGAVCNGTVNGTLPGRDFQITGTASTVGVPDQPGSTITNSATATWTYLDGTPGTVTSTTNTNVVSAVPTLWLSKGPVSQSLSNQGQYVYPPNSGVYQWYTYPGDWNGSGISAQYAISMATNGVQAGADFALQDPMPCQTNNATPGTATNPNYFSNAPGTVCSSPAFIPTRILAIGFTPTASDLVTVVHTDGTIATVAWDSITKTWPIPTSPAVSELDFPQFQEEGANTSTTVQLLMEGYAAPNLLTTSLITNAVTGNAFLVGSNTPLTAQQNYAASVMVVSPTSPSGTVIEPGIWPRYGITPTCTESVAIGSFGGGGPQSNIVEIAKAPSQAFYVSYLAPAGATVTSGTTQTFTFTPTSFSAFPAGPPSGAPASAGAIAATVTTNYNGTGRTLLQWVIPAGTVTVPGDYFFTGVEGLTVDFGAGCAGVYQNDFTVGYGAPITDCPPGKHFPPSNGTNNALNTTNAPDQTNYCGESQNITVAPTNPAFSVNKTVQGNLDAVPVGSGGVGNVSPTGGTATYQISFANTGQSNLTNPVMYDLLPRVGDTLATSLTPRNSQFAVALTGVGPLPSGVTVFYSTATNPCRPEVLATNPGCVNDWSATPPASLGTTTALKFVYTGTVTVTGASGTHSFSVPFTVSTPTTTPGQIAWNTVGTNAFAGVNLMGAAESSQTGLQAKVGPTITKSTTATSYAHPGDTLTYTYTVTNNTAVTLTNVGVTDNLTDAASSSVAPTVTCVARTTPAATCSGTTTTLAPNQVATFTATYPVTQGDLDHGLITDTATAAGTPPTGGTLSNTSTPVTVNATRSPALTVVKSAQPTAVTAAGQTVTYSFLVTNTGNVTVTGIGISETAFSGTGTLSAVSCPQSSLAPTAQETCAASYPVTQADMDAGSITNTAKATGTAGTTPVASATSSATVTATQSAALTLVKSASPSSAAAYHAGQHITYSYVVTNTGNVTITGIGIHEVTFTGSNPLTAPTCPQSTLAPHQQEVCTTGYDLTQPDIDSGSTSNTATATGTAGITPVTSNPSTVTTPSTPAPALTLAKSASPTTVSAVGDTVTYSYLVTNTGNVTVSTIGIDETAFSGAGTAPVPTCPLASLLPGQQETCTATYQVIQADLDAGSIANTAHATGAFGATPVSSAPSVATVTVTQRPALTLAKSADPTTVTAAGQTVTYSFLVTNTGNVTLSTISIDDSTFSGTGTPSAVSCPPGSLAPGAHVTCTSTYDVTQADLDAGSITNTATAAGTPPTGPAVHSAQSSALVTATQTAALTLVKSADPSTASQAGQHITYSYVITNTGNVTVTGVGITEGTFTGSAALTAPTCPQPTLAPGQQEVCTTGYDLTQTDVNAGSVSNTATATGTAGGTPVTSDPSTVTTPAAAAPALTLVKSADPTTVTTAGQTVTYSYLVTNTGNVTVTGVGIDESAFSGSGTAPVPDCPDATLAPGQFETCTATYSVTQADLDDGSITNTASATGSAGNTPVTSPTSSAIVTATQSAALTLVKSASPSAAAAYTVGQHITYSYVVTNTGNVTVTGVGIHEVTFTGSGGPLATPSCPQSTLAPGQQEVCTTGYDLTQPDIDAGVTTNTATATGTAGQDPVTSDPSTVTTPVTPAPALTLAKSADPTIVAAAGDTVTYSYLVTNTGNVTVSTIGIDETAFSGTGTAPAPSCPLASLLPGQHETCTATYHVTQADLEAGSVTNTAKATGTAGNTAVASDPSGAVVTATQTPAITLTKSADPTTVTAAGQRVTYSFLVTNTGNVTLSNVSIDDSTFSGTGTPSAVSCPPGTLAPGAHVTCTSTYDVTQADLDAGSITNTATASGTPPSGPPVTSPTSSAIVTATQSPALTLVKSADPSAAAAYTVGQHITYSYVVTNTGNVTVTGIGIHEVTFTGSGGPLTAPSCPQPTLAPGQQEVCTTGYDLTQPDIDAGKITNTATATGTAGTTPVTSDPSTVTTPATPAPALTLAKSASPTTVSAVGDTVTYSYLVTNTGNVTVSGIGIDETVFTGTGTAPAPSCPIASLLPGQHETCTATYHVTAADLEAGSITNTAKATGTAGNTAVASDPSTAVVTATQTPTLTLTKSADPTTVTAAGQTVTYSFLVTNTGNVTLSDISIDDSTFSGTGTPTAIHCPATTLAPAAHTTCTATYSVTQADIDTGSITNTATATGTPPTGPPVHSARSTAIVNAPAAPGLTLVKSASPSSPDAFTVGQHITYTFVVTNTGNVTVTHVVIDDASFSGSGTLSAISCPSGTTLAPGAETICTATYTLTQTDIDAGKVTNTATASGRTPGGDPVDSPPSTVTIPGVAHPGLTLVKTASPSTVTTVGQSITYSFLVTNTGNVTVTGVSVHEGAFTGAGMLSAISCPSTTTLAPGAHLVCTATYRVTQADLAAHAISNTATASGTSSVGPIDSSPSTATVTVSAGSGGPGGGPGGSGGSPGGSGGHGGSGPPLADTGTPVLQLVGLGGLLTVLGVLVLTATNLRRRQRSRQA